MLRKNKGLSQGPRGVLSASRNGFGSTRAEGGRGPPCPTMSAAPPLPRDFGPARGRAGLPSPHRPARVSPCPPANRRGTRGSAGLTRTYATAPRRPGQGGRRSSPWPRRPLPAPGAPRGPSPPSQPAPQPPVRSPPRTGRAPQPSRASARAPAARSVPSRPPPLRRVPWPVSTLRPLGRALSSPPCRLTLHPRSRVAGTTGSRLARTLDGRQSDSSRVGGANLAAQMRRAVKPSPALVSEVCVSRDEEV